MNKPRHSLAIATLAGALVLGAAVQPAIAQTHLYMARLGSSGTLGPSTVSGTCLLLTSNDNRTLRYFIFVSNVTNATQAHIHLGPAGQDGEMVAQLYPHSGTSQVLSGLYTGLLAEGSLTREQLTGTLLDTSLEQLLHEIEAGHAYVDVHSERPGGSLAVDALGRMQVVYGNWWGGWLWSGHF